MNAFRSSVVRWSSLAFFVLVGVADASAQTNLSWKFKKGDSLKLVFHQKNDIKIQVAAQNIANVSELTIDLTWDVKNVQDGTAEITQTIDRVRAKVDSPKEKIDYDSKDKKDGEGPSAQALHQLYNSVVGAKYEIKVDARGQIQSVKIPQTVADVVNASPFKALADGGSILSEAGLKNMMAQVIPPSPEEPVTAGKKWEESFTLPAGPLVMKVTNRYTLGSLDAKSAKVEGEIDTQMSAAPGSPLAVMVKKQSGSGTYEYDPAAGRLANSQIKQRFEMTLKVQQQEIGQTIELVADLKVSLAGR